MTTSAIRREAFMRYLSGEDRRWFYIARVHMRLHRRLHILLPPRLSSPGHFQYLNTS